jgi:hypothetical protein
MTTAISTTEAKPAVNYVFVDYENVKQIDMRVIGAKTVHFSLLLGAQDKKLEVELVEKLLEYPNWAQIIRLQSNGKNALDFAIAYYLGKAAHTDPTAYFHIVSGDAGYDPLIEHLRNRQIKVYRHADFSSLTFSYSPKTHSPLPIAEATGNGDMVAIMAERLKKGGNNRPKRKESLISHLKAQLGSTSTESQANVLLEKLRKQGHLEISDKDEVTYHLDSK